MRKIVVMLLITLLAQETWAQSAKVDSRLLSFVQKQFVEESIYAIAFENNAFNANDLKSLFNIDHIAKVKELSRDFEADAKLADDKYKQTEGFLALSGTINEVGTDEMDIPYVQLSSLPGLLYERPAKFKVQAKFNVDKNDLASRYRATNSTTIVCKFDKVQKPYIVLNNCSALKPFILSRQVVLDKLVKDVLTGNVKVSEGIAKTIASDYTLAKNLPEKSICFKVQHSNTCRKEVESLFKGRSEKENKALEDKMLQEMEKLANSFMQM